MHGPLQGGTSLTPTKLLLQQGMLHWLQAMLLRLPATPRWDHQLLAKQLQPPTGLLWLRTTAGRPAGCCPMPKPPPYHPSATSPPA